MVYLSQEERRYFQSRAVNLIRTQSIASKKKIVKNISKKNRVKRTKKYTPAKLCCKLLLVEDRNSTSKVGNNSTYSFANLFGKSKKRSFSIISNSHKQQQFKVAKKLENTSNFYSTSNNGSTQNSSSVNIPCSTNTIQSSCLTTDDDFEDKIIALRLQSMKKYLKPLSIVTEKTLQEISKNNNANLIHALEKLNTYKSIIDGTPFSTPENMTKHHFLQQLEETLSKLTTSLKQKYPEEFDDEPVVSTNTPLNQKPLLVIGLESVLQRLNIREYLDVFTKNGIFTVEDLKLLSEQNMRELKIPMGVQNRIRNYFQTSSPSINQLMATKPEASNLTIESYQKQICNQLWESFICPITHDLMVDPVIAADGHTYDREAISKWFITNNISPLTGSVLHSTALIPNHNLRSQIRQFYSTISYSGRD